MAKLSPHFVIQEFVPPEIFSRFGDSSIWFIDKRIVDLAEFIRGRWKVMTINNWHTGGPLKNRGFRSPETTVGGSLSQHKFKAAIDFNIAGMTPQEVYADIMANEIAYLAAGLTTVEDVTFTPGWTHCDIRYTGLVDDIFVVRPS